MKLSMSMLRWYLREYEPGSYIVNDSRCIEGMRFLIDETIDLCPQYVYLGAADNFLSDEKYCSSYIIVNGQNCLMLSGCEYEELLNEVLGAFDYFSMWENRLLEAAAAHAPLQELVDIGKEVIENPFFIYSFDGSVFACGRTSRLTDEYWDSNAQGNAWLNAEPLYLPYYTCEGEVIHDLSEEPVLVKNVWPQGKPVLMMYLTLEGEAVATLSIKQDDEDMTQMDMQTSVILAGYLILAREFYGASALVRPGVALLKDCLDGRMADPTALMSLQDRFGCDVWRLAAIRHITRDDHIQKASLISSLQAAPGVCIAFEYDSLALAVIPDQNCRDGLALPEDQIDPRTLCVGLSMAATQLSNLPVYYRQARFALDCLKSAPGTAKCEDHAFRYLVGVLGGQPLVAELYHPAIGALEDYDRQTGAELAKTLYTYLLCDRNLAGASQALNVHRNTLKYRLKRIRELTSLDLSDTLDREYLVLSFLLKYQAQGQDQPAKV